MVGYLDDAIRSLVLLLSRMSGYVVSGQVLEIKIRIKNWCLSNDKLLKMKSIKSFGLRLKTWKLFN